MPFGTITSTESTFGSISGSIVGAVPGTLSGSVGVPGPQGPAGSPGSVGPQGPQGIPGVAGQGVPTGGSVNQYLVKTSGADFATGWSTLDLSAYATQSFVNAGFAPIGAGVPISGTIGQVLTKNSGTSWDASWQTLIPGDRYVTTSSSTLSVSNGNKSFTIGTGLAYTPNQDVTISLTSDPTLHHMHGQVVSYNSGTGAMTVNVQNHTGSGTYSSWTVNVGGIVPLQTVEWGEILGTLGDQTDLASALNAKLEITDAASTYQTLSGMSDYLSKAGNLSGLSDNATARSNLGLGNFATVNDAPSDGQTYGRNNGAWVVAGGGSSPADALTVNQVDAVADAGFVQFSPPAQDSETYGSGSLSFQDSQIGANGKTVTFFGSNSFSISNLGTSWSIGLMTDSLDPGYPKYVEDLVSYVNGQGLSLSASWSGTTGTDTVDGLTSYTFTLQRSIADIQAGDRLMIEQGLKEYLTSNALASTAAANTVLTYAGPDQGSIVNWAKPWQSEGYMTTSTAFGNFASLANNNTLNGRLTLSASTTSRAPFNIPHGVDSTSPQNGDIWTTTAGLFYYINGSTVSPATLAGGTFTGLINTAASTTAGAGFRLPHGTAPTTPTDGDLFTTTSGLFARINGTTRQYVDFDGTQTINGAKTFSNANQTLGNSTAAGTIAIGTGATISGATKTINIGTSGVSGSTTNISVGPIAGASSITVGATTAASTLNLATGATLTATTKAINIGTNGVSGSTTSISIGSSVSGATCVTTISGNLTTTGTSHSIANSTAAQTVSIGAGSTISGATKEINIGSNGVSGSTTNINVGSNLSSGTVSIQSAGTVTVTGSTTCNINGATINVGGSNTNITVALGSGSMSSGVTKTVNIGTAGVAGATVNVNIGSTNGTSTTTLQGITNGVTQAALDSSTKLATTAFVRTDNNVKAWVNFNGTGTPAVTAGFNVNSITDNGVGDYTLNFLNALADSSYAVVTSDYGRTGFATGLHTAAGAWAGAPTTKTTSAVRIAVGYYDGNLYDVKEVHVAILR